MMVANARPQLSLCMIVCDNEPIIRPCLESIRPWVDDMAVVDTGSRDATPNIASELGARVFHFPWCDDFSAARNESLRHAIGDWIFWMDSDDTIDAENGRKLKELVTRAHLESHLAHVMQVHCLAPPGEPDESMTIVDHVKLFRNNERIRFTGRIHEQVLPSIRALGGSVGWTDLFVVHSGSDQTEEGRKRKYERDLRHLHLELEEHPDHPFVLFNFGMTYNDMGEHEEAIRWLRRSIGRSQPEESHLRKAYALLASSLHALGRHSQAEETCVAGLTLFPQDVELHFRRGMVAHALGQCDLAVKSYRAAVAAQEKRHFTSIDRGVTGYKAHHNLALVYEDMRDCMSAELQFRRALQQVPSFRPSWRGLLNVLLTEERFATAESEIERMQTTASLAAEALLQKAELMVRRGALDEGLALARNAYAQFPDDLTVLQTACRLFFEQESLHDAEQALRRLAGLLPQDASVLHNLGNVLLKKGNLAEAISCLESSLDLRHEAPATWELLACACDAAGDARRARELRRNCQTSIHKPSPRTDADYSEMT